MSAIKRLASYAGVDILAALLGLITSPITTRLLSIEQYGAISYIAAAWTPFMVARYAGVDWSFIFFKSRKGTDQESLISSCTQVICISSVVVGFVFFAFALQSGIFRGEQVIGLYEVSFFVMGVILVALVDWFLLLLRFSHQATIYAKISVIQKVCVILVALPAMYMSSPEKRLLVYFFVAAFVPVVSLLYAIRVMHHSGLQPFAWRFGSFPVIKELLAYGVFLVPGGILYALIAVADRLLLGSMSGVEAVALLALATALSAPITMLKKWVSLVLNPLIVDWVRDLEQAEYTRNLDALLHSLSVFFFPVVVLITIWAKPVVQILYTENYHLSATLVPVLAFSGVLAVLTLVAISTVLISQNRSATLKINLLALLANIMLAVYLIPRYGAIGAALGTVLAEFLILMIWAAVGSLLHKNLVLNWMRILPVIAVVFLLVLMGAFHFYQDVGFLQRALASVLCLGLSTAYFWFNSRNLKIVKQLL
ncbi:MAG: oligosaccharide flippase family protein [Candidimonas sp.]|nr:oligosaccharide flippase family protein [Candidimonas sp.]